MSTIVLILNDSIASCDTAVVKLATVAEYYQPIVKDAETNSSDVAIVIFICAAIVVMALFAMCAVLFWKSMEINAAKKEREDQKTEKAEESKRKQKNDLIERLLDYVKKQAEGTNETGKNVGAKSNNQEKCKAYEKVLCELIAATPDKDIDVERLRTALGVKNVPSQNDSNNPPQK